MITKFKIFENNSNQLLISDEEYNEYLEELKLNTNWDDERAREDLDYYIDKVSELQNNGGHIYRLVWLFDEKNLDSENLGDHWNIDGDFDNFYGNLENRESDENGNERKPYLIIAKIKPGNINIDDSFQYYTELPNELEINLNENPTNFKLIQYERYTDYSHIIIESQRSDDALKLFFFLYKEKEHTFFDMRVEKEFKISKLPKEFFEEFKILYFYYWDNGYRLARHTYDDLIDRKTPLSLLDNTYIKNQIKRYVKNSISEKFNNNNSLYIELENNELLNDRFRQFSNFYSVELNYVFSVFRMILKYPPNKLKAVRKFKI